MAVPGGDTKIYNFAGIQASGSSLLTIHTQFNATFEHIRGTIMPKLAAFWEGSNSGAWQTEQTQWNSEASQLHLAGVNLTNKYNEAGTGMQVREASLTSGWTGGGGPVSI